MQKNSKILNINAKKIFLCFLIVATLIITSAAPASALIANKNEDSNEIIKFKEAEEQETKKIKSLNSNEKTFLGQRSTDDLIYQLLKTIYNAFPFLYNITFFANLIESFNDSEEPPAEDTTPPSKVMGLTLTSFTNMINLSWDAATDNIEIDYYNVYRDDFTNPMYQTSDLAYLDTDVVQDVEYNYSISAVDTSGNEGEKSDIVTGSSLYVEDNEDPSQVTGLTVTDAFNGKLQLKWDAATDNVGVDFYKVYRDSALLIEINALEYLDSGLTNDQSYSYQISAVDFSGNEGEKSNPESGTPTENIVDDEPPSKVAGLEIENAFDGELMLSWDAATDNVEIDHYKIYRDSIFLIETSNLEYLDSGLTNDQSYSYEISAVDTSDNEGEKSDPASGTPTESTGDETVVPESGHIMISGNGYLKINTTLNINGTIVVLNGTLFLNTGIESIHIWWNLTTGFFKINASSFTPDGTEEASLIDFYIEIKDSSTEPDNIIQFYLSFVSMDASSCIELNNNAQTGMITFDGTLKIGNINGYVSINDWQNITLQGSFYANNYKEIEGQATIQWDLTTEKPIILIKGNLSNDFERYFNVDDLLFEIKDTILVTADNLNFSSNGGFQVGDGFITLESSVKRLKIENLVVNLAGFTVHASATLDIISGGNITIYLGEDDITIDIPEEMTIFELSGLYLNINNGQIFATCDSLYLSGYGSVVIGDDIILDAAIENANIDNLYFEVNSKTLALSGDLDLGASADIYIKTDASLETLEIQISASATLTITNLYANLNNGLIIASCSSVEIEGYGTIMIGDEIMLAASLTKFDVSYLHILLNSKDLMVSGNFNLNAAARIFVKTDLALKQIQISLSAGGSLTITGLNANLNNGAIKATCISIVISGAGSIYIGNSIVFDAALTSADINTLYVEVNGEEITLSGYLSLSSTAIVHLKSDLSLKEFQIYLSASGSLTITDFNFDMNSGAVLVSFNELVITGYGSLEFDDDIILDASLTYVYLDTFYAYSDGEKMTISGTFNLNAAGSLYIKTDLSNYVEFSLNSGSLTITGLVAEINDNEIYITCNTITLTAGGSGQVIWDEEKLTVDGSGTITLDITTFTLSIDTSTADITVNIPNFYASLSATADELEVYFEDDGNGGGGGGGDDPIQVILKGDLTISGNLEITITMSSTTIDGETAAKIDLSLSGSGSIDLDNFVLEMPLGPVGQTEFSWSELHLSASATGYASIIQSMSSGKIKIETLQVSGYIKTVGIDLKDVSFLPKITITQLDLYAGGDLTINWDTDSFSKYVKIESQNGFEIKITDLTAGIFSIESIDGLDIGSQSSFEFRWEGNDYYKKYDLSLDGSFALAEFVFTSNFLLRELGIGQFSGSNVHITISNLLGANIDVSGNGQLTAIGYNGPFLTLDWVSLSVNGDIETDWFDHDTFGSGTIHWVSTSGFDGSFDFQTTLFKSENKDFHLHGDIDLGPTGGYTYYFQWDLFGNWHPDGWKYVAAYLPGSNSDPAINSYNLWATINGCGPKLTGQNIWQEGETYQGTYYETFLRKWLPLPPITIGDIHGNNNYIYTTDNDGASWTLRWPVENQAPTADAGGPYIGNINNAVNFDFSGCDDSDGTVEKMKVDWDGDGTWDTGTVLNRWIDFNSNPTHTYSTEGTYELKLQVRDNDLKTSDVVTATVTITDDKGQIQGHVYDDQGNPLSLAHVTTDHGGYSANTNTNGAYSFEVDPGTYYVSASKSYYEAETQGPIAISGSETETVDFYLNPTAKLVGDVYDQYGQPIGSALVEILGTPHSQITLEYGANKGHYVFDDGEVTPGNTYQIRASKSSDGINPVTKSITIVQGSNSLDFQLQRPTNPPTIVTNDETDVESDRAVLHGYLQNLGGEPSCEVWFGYKKTSSSTYSYTTHFTKTQTGSYQYLVTGLTHSTQYEFKAIAENDAGTSYGSNKYFTTSACFLAGTKITMADGSYRNIENIKPGDMIKSFDEETGENKNSRVAKVFYHQEEYANYYYLLINGKIRVTPNHPMYVNNLWTNSDKIEIGDSLQDIKGLKIQVFSIEKIFEKVPTYNLEVENYHTYYAEEILVHNKDDPQPEWVRATSGSGTYWTNIPYAYDSSTSTSAESMELGWNDGWQYSTSLYLTRPMIECSKIRFNALYHQDYIDSVIVKVYYNGAYHTVHTGAFSNGYYEVSLGGTYQVTKATLMFHYKGCLGGTTCEVYDFQFWKEV